MVATFGKGQKTGKNQQLASETVTVTRMEENVEARCDA